MGLSTARRSGSTNIFASGRQSLAPNQLFGSQTPASQSVQRRSSVYSRPSGHGSAPPHQSFFLTSSSVISNPKDPRPLRDPSFRARISQELLTYLTENNFELDMKFSLRQDSLKSPSQKEFTNIFQWLYKRLDPGYRFQKAVDTEVPPILKQLRYPYANQITKSQLGAVGSQTSWPNFLGMLHWLMQLSQMLDNFQRGAYDDACAESGLDVSGDRIVLRFLYGAYQDWLCVGNDETDEDAEAAVAPHVQAMAEEFERINARHNEELKIFEAEHATLKEQVEELEKSTPDVAKLDKHYKILEDDTKKFEDYNANVAAKIEKYDSRLKMLEEEIQKTEADLATVEQERQSLQQSVDRQGLNIQDIDRMNTERERLTKSHDDAINTLDDVNKKVLAKEAETAQKLEELESVIKRYNSLGYQLSLIPSSAPNAKGTDYELSLNIPATTFSTSQASRSTRKPSASEGDRLLASSTTGHAPARLLTLDLRGAVRSTFISLRKEIYDRRKAAIDADMSNKDLLDNVVEALNEKNTEIENLDYRVNEASTTYNSLKETGNTSHTQQTVTIEKLEKELGRMRSDLDRGAVELEQREMEVGLAWEAMQEEAGRIREELHSGIERILEEVVNFKVHVQKGLEEFEGWVTEEVEGELEGEGQKEEDVFE